MSERFLLLGEGDGKGGFRMKSPQEQAEFEAQQANEKARKEFPELYQLNTTAMKNIAMMLGLNEDQAAAMAMMREQMYRSSAFQQDCILMNTMYQVMPKEKGMKLPTDVELIGSELEVGGFVATLQDEVDEGIAIADLCERYEGLDSTTPEAEKLMVDIYVAFIDWLVDIQVFCMSQALRYGINLLPFMTIVMDSNFTKLGEDGKPIFDANGKFLKGPNYRKPEPAIRELLVAYLKAQKEKSCVD